jgi:hypothetical protein
MQFVMYNNFPEVFGVAVGLKQASVIRLDDSDPRSIETLKRGCEAEGIVFRLVDWNEYSVEHGINEELVGLKTDENLMAFIALSEDVVEETIDVYMNHEVPRIGELLGYPDCCVKAWMRRAKEREESLLGDNVRFSRMLNNLLKYQFWSSVKGSRHFSSYLNTFSIGNRITPHYPCSFDCRKSRELASRYLEEIGKLDPGKLARVKRDLNLPVLVSNLDRFLKFEKTDGRLELLGPWNCGAALDGYSRMLSRLDDRELLAAGEAFAWLWRKRGGFPKSGDFHGMRWMEWDEPVE